MIPIEHVKLRCQPNTANCCRYLSVGSTGWTCERLTALRAVLDRRAESGKMRATAVNCDGYGPDGTYCGVRN